MVNKSFYNTILSQIYSPCGKYLIVGDIYGQISIFNVYKIINPESNLIKQNKRPQNTFTIKSNIQINTLEKNAIHLIVGCVDAIYGYTWKNVLDTTIKELKPVWTIAIPCGNDSLDKIDINCLIFNANDNQLLAGCGDNKIHAIDIEHGSISHSFTGHKDYVHNLFYGNAELISCGEDGLVNIWDLRTQTVARKLEPYKNDKVNRPHLGKWIGAVSANEDWLVCGGGPRLSLWHYRSLNAPSTVFPINDAGIHVTLFDDDKILAGGRAQHFYHMSLNGDIVTEVATSSVSIYSAALQRSPYNVLCLSGSSPNIDVCSNFNYRDQVLTLSEYYE